MKNSFEIVQRKDLYIDESGTSYIGQDKFRFFVLTAVLIEQKERAAANILLQKWREKHLLNSNMCLHAFDYFENTNPKAKHILKSEVSIEKNFKNSVEELWNFISYIKFDAVSFYVDLPKSRKLLHIPEPELDKKKYSSKLKDSYAGVLYSPLDSTIIEAFNYHTKTLVDNIYGYINIESNSNSDTRLISTFHKYGNYNSEYRNKILGLRVHTKKSLDAGIEIADFISYISFQNLRFRHRLKSELIDIPDKRQNIIKELRIKLRARNINLVEVELKHLTNKKS